MRHFLDLSKTEVEELFAKEGQPKYRARQTMRWVLARGATTFNEMSDLPVELRSTLDRQLSLDSLPVISRTESDDGATTKVLLDLGCGDAVEAVRMDHVENDDRYESDARDDSKHRPNGSTVCVSTQVGCAMGCTFCATGQQGFTRNLTSAEIIEQVLCFSRHNTVSNIVFMGMGEPLANYTATIGAVRWMIDANGLGLSARAITISTVGMRTGLRRLAKEGLPLGLAISLHAPDDKLRHTLIPTATGTSIDDLIAAARDYIDGTGRRVTFAYTLIDRVNDSVSQARLLASRLRGIQVHVNLIPYNPIVGQEFQRPTRRRVREFQRELQSNGVNTTVRVERGTDISAACGQLRTNTIPAGIATRSKT